MVDFLGHDVRTKDRATTAQAIAALCIGGMVTARAMDDRRLADALRNACLVVALRLGGWQKKASS
jgi:TetR/AcrR family transcriptional repressor of nem operon